LQRTAREPSGILYIVYNGLDKKTGFPAYTANLAISDNHGLTFTTHPLEKFLSPAKDDGDQRQRVLGDYEQLKAVATTFYGVQMACGDDLLRSSDGPAAHPWECKTRCWHSLILNELGASFEAVFAGNGVPFGRPFANIDPIFFKTTVSQ
jgi:hypothetical protein